MNKKFLIYYEPARASYEYIKSASLVFSRMSNNDNLYKQKYVIEHKSKNRQRIEEYKMTEVHLGADKIREKIDSIDFEKIYPSPIRDDKHEYFYISYDNKIIETSDRESIVDILVMFRFEELLGITHKHFQYIKDMYEYIDLVKVLDSKISGLSKEQTVTLAKIFKPNNPYIIFQSMGWLNQFLEDMKYSCD